MVELNKEQALCLKQLISVVTLNRQKVELPVLITSLNTIEKWTPEDLQMSPQQIDIFKSLLNVVEVNDFKITVQDLVELWNVLNSGTDTIEIGDTTDKKIDENKVSSINV